MSDAVALAQQLIRVDTVNQGEDDCIAILAPLLETAGFELVTVPWRPGRSNLIATWAGGGDLVLSGHLDTVPYDASTWTAPPLGAEIDGDRLYGRGSSDMKAGVAAMAVAAIAAAHAGSRGFHLALSASEETGCLGAIALAASGLLPANPLLIVGEATGNQIRLGHKGATWLQVDARGRSAHGSRPELGINAIDDLVRAAGALAELPQREAHPRLGGMTTNLGTISGGQQTNLVPDSASMTVDIRTVPGTDVAAIETALLTRMHDGSISTLLNLPAIWTDEKSAETAALGEIATIAAEGATYFTDAAVLADPANPRVYILGPGDIDQPHTSNESCSVTAIETVVELYRAILSRS